jgi:CDP-diacylglycerol--glycerol-3-phosphate 3-phosphatidyltransferase
MTDWLDGYLARKNNEVTTLGKFLDPLADKLLIVTALIMLISLDRAQAWIVALIVGREIAVTGLRSIAMAEGLVLQASPMGKTKTVAQICAIVPLLIHYRFYGVDFQKIGTVLLWVALILTLWSGVDYVRKFFGATSGGEGEG